jgi:hypothetical protein
MEEGVGFEPTRERNPLLVFKTSALNHSAILPRRFGRSGGRTRVPGPTWVHVTGRQNALAPAAAAAL